jgi:bilirubin oxidase
MVLLTRRGFLAAGVVAGVAAGATADNAWSRRGPGRPPPVIGLLDARQIPKYRTPLLVPPAMPTSSASADLDRYVIGMRQFRQQVLPVGLPETTVWGYGSETTAGTHHFPSFTIEARVDRPVRVTWVNGLVDSDGRYLPHLLTVDPTVHWANPPGGIEHRDGHGEFMTTPEPYTGPVPIVAHLHGGHSAEESDGFTEAWYLPAATDIPAGYATVGSYYEEFAQKFADKYGERWAPGSAMAQYDNDQPAATLWYHDHALGITRLNVMAGPAGFYLLRGGAYDLDPGVLPGPAPALGDPPGTRYHEIPLAIQDRSFNRDGSIYFPNSRALFDGYSGPYFPETDVAPYWTPAFYGTTMLVNGNTWPDLQVEARRYRFRILNGCNARFLVLRLGDRAGTSRARTVAPFWKIGVDGGFLDRPVQLEQLLVAPAERADVVVDFSGVRPGTQVFLLNEGPDGPFPQGGHGAGGDVADPATTGQVMRFTVVDRVGPDTSIPPEHLNLPAPPMPTGGGRTRDLVLVEKKSALVAGALPVQMLLGVVGNGRPEGLYWDDPVTESPRLGSTETWVIHNRTQEAHPIHLHLVMFEVLHRRPAGRGVSGPEASERGLKDTVIAYPGMTTVRAHFDKPGLFVWHCHMLGHEDHEMMRPFRVVRT